MHMSGTEEGTGQTGWQTLIENLTKSVTGVATGISNIRTQQALTKINIQRAAQGLNPVSEQVYRAQPVYASPGSQLVGDLFSSRNLMFLGGAAVLFMFLRRKR